MSGKAHMAGTSDALVTNSPRSKRARGLNFRELMVLERNSGYMERVRLPQMQNACDCLLTLRHHGFGGAPLGVRACALHGHGHGHRNTTHHTLRAPIRTSLPHTVHLCWVRGAQHRHCVP